MQLIIYLNFILIQTIKFLLIQVYPYAIKSIYIQQKQTSNNITPKMIQMFRVFQLPYSDIVDEIKHERDDNVFIEIEQEDSLITQSSTRHHDQLNTQDISEYTKDIAKNRFINFFCLSSN